MITPEEKDKVLTAIMAQPGTSTYLLYKHIPNLKVSEDEFWLIIDQLKKKELIACNNYGHITKTADLYDFCRHGGFTGQEEILKANLEKLNSELIILSSKLEPSQVERIKNITEIASSVATFLNLIFR